MRMLFMIFTIAERSFKIPELPANATTNLIRRQTHNYGYDYSSSPTQVELSREATRLVIRRLQRTVLRLIRDPDFSMSAEANPKPEDDHQDTPFAANRKGSTSSSSAGKQDSNCRTCNDFKSWSKQQRLISNVQSAKVKHMAAAEKVATVTAAEVAAPRDDCPLDKVRLGISTWGLLHTMAAFYSDNPTDTEKRDMKTFFEVLSRLYPCEFCAKDFRTDLDVNPINVNSQKELAMWLCKFHNRVNDKLGKPLFDCSKVNERWRDGWLDGSCD
ncbi:FAD-linked sulfhydryl oxidase ALR isoform X2 [Drosophila ficusphila]|uniref:FAD-linked sulfhydryl oxidase ALR isoform X2 n=1 Tax=Drosophila ficusphila TaxID=30025 RepID=UPI0007E6EC8E|nr:FAD-linked sulfhydryl oxidase ALR isoform X2 [Drosophila ficusphila]XP_043063267.1 FAD-linked sulfhydryl oxidase ALR isoform X2 [Drosophila ficusphila]